ncbi:MAG: glycosyltransferase [Bacteroidia bacterium]|nr:glycosyltransferase [Bacteroidia bacterium]
MASAVFSISKAGENYLQKKFPDMKDKFFTSYLGVEDRGEGTFNEKEVFTMVSCSGMSENKRVSVMAEVFSEFKFPARWIHFGDGPEMEKTKSIVAKLPAHLRAELRGYTANEKVMDYYKNNSVNLFINLSLMEGIPVSLMEAISFGIPVLATNVYGNPELANKETGFLIEENFRINEVAVKISDFAGNIDSQKSLRISSRKFCLETFNNEKNFSAFSAEILKWTN